MRLCLGGLHQVNRMHSSRRLVLANWIPMLTRLVVLSAASLDDQIDELVKLSNDLVDPAQYDELVAAGTLSPAARAAADETRDPR